MKLSKMFIAMVCVMLTFGLVATGQPEPGEDVEVEFFDAGNGVVGPHRTPALIPISGYASLSFNALILFSNTITDDAEVLVSNLSTGDSDGYEVEIGSSPILLPLSGSGAYYIMVTLSSGVIYYGAFEL